MDILALKMLCKSYSFMHMWAFVIKDTITPLFCVIVCGWNVQFSAPLTWQLKARDNTNMLVFMVDPWKVMYSEKSKSGEACGKFRAASELSAKK